MGTEKYKTFSVQNLFLEKQVINIDEDDNESVVTISYKIKLIYSAEFMATSLSNLVHNLTERNHNFKCKECDYFIEYESVKNNLIKCKCLSCNKEYSNKFDKGLEKRFKNKFISFLKRISIIFILLLNEGIYLYDYIDKWGNFNKTAFPEKEEFYSNLNTEDIIDADYMHAKRTCKEF